MDKYQLFFDDNHKAIVIEDDPAAIDTAPYERMQRRPNGMADALIAEFALRAYSGVAFYADGRQIEVEAF